MWIQTNPNPCGYFVGDCVVRALSIALNQSWERTYLELMITGFEECDMPSANHVWGTYLEKRGFERCSINGNNVSTVASQLPNGVFILATGEHVVTVIDRNYYDAWDSGNEFPIFIWKERLT